MRAVLLMALRKAVIRATLVTATVGTAYWLGQLFACLFAGATGDGYLTTR